jgi:uncharacterized OB-fold protein
MNTPELYRVPSSPPLAAPACARTSTDGKLGHSEEEVARMADKVPLVDYLVLADEPHLVANECTNCGARYFNRRNACAACEGADFRKVTVPTQGEVRAFSIVSFAAPGIPVPFVAAVVDCDGTSVRSNLVNVDPDPEHVQLGMKVRLTTFPLGADSEGTEAVGFGFEPLEATRV